MKAVYLDNAATTALRPEVVDRMTKVLNENFGNASSTHSFGRSSKALLEQCRKNIASYFNVTSSEIVFTSGGTEADNLALRSVIRDLGVTEIITSKIEHHAVLHTAEQLQKEYNIVVKYVDLDPCGLINYSHLEQLLASSNKAIVSLMHINNEVGNILDIKQVAELCKANNALFHSDMVQSVGHYKIDLQDITVDFMAASAHKFHGPKGVGFCFVRKESGLKPLIFGGEQERGYRAGTESTHNIVGMDEALKIAYARLDEEKKYVSDLKTYFIQQLKTNLLDVHFNGGCEDVINSTYTLINVCLPIAPEKAPMLQFQLDLKGIACSKGSACQSGSSQQSHVLTELLNAENLKRPSVRFSFSVFNTQEELDYVIWVLKEFVNS
ncbi:cysteine desulfurase family protein [Winogradskyella sp. PG-2]|uniref:cysteine desulfurase family protein n=1 Tax=Winogradskyella sp. PG-2 TaxID=754409 RepID=UPI0004586F55|nr:cysteine desulfurase family protein [Winogradskyella sp. PG-2]BAO77106.1 cysteine desulfurase [Winogradskyella sp. PG-2]